MLAHEMQVELMDEKKMRELMKKLNKFDKNKKEEQSLHMQSSENTFKMPKLTNPFKLATITNLKDPNVVVDIDALAKLNGRINTYFKTIKKQVFALSKAEQRIDYKDIQIQMVEQLKD